MDKPEFVWISEGATEEIGIVQVDLWPTDYAEQGDVKFRITYNEAGKVIRLERVEGDKP